MQAPTATELLNEPAVQQALDAAWVDSLPADPVGRHEEGGWIYLDTSTEVVTVRRAPAGTRAVLDLNTPPVVAGCVVVATFHTHTTPRAAGWDAGPRATHTL